MAGSGQTWCVLAPYMMKKKPHIQEHKFILVSTWHVLTFNMANIVGFFTSIQSRVITENQSKMIQNEKEERMIGITVKNESTLTSGITIFMLRISDLLLDWFIFGNVL